MADQVRRHRVRSPPAGMQLHDAESAVQFEPADLDLDIATIAEVMGCAPGTVKATLHQARARLRELVGDHDD